MKKLLVAGTVLLSVAAVYATQGGSGKMASAHNGYSVSHYQNDTIPSKDTAKPSKKDSLSFRF